MLWVMHQHHTILVYLMSIVFFRPRRSGVCRPLHMDQRPHLLTGMLCIKPQCKTHNTRAFDAVLSVVQTEQLLMCRYENINTCAYWISVVQHPYGEPFF